MKDQPLSPRETTVLHYVAWGYTNKEIALCLDLSVKTVEAHKYTGMRKLGVGRLADLVRYGVERGWLTPSAAPQLSGSPRGANHAPQD
jgi:DNA-binding CsgD family transcriptional regulator